MIQIIYKWLKSVNTNSWHIPPKHTLHTLNVLNIHVLFPSPKLLPGNILPKMSMSTISVFWHGCHVIMVMVQVCLLFDHHRRLLHTWVVSMMCLSTVSAGKLWNTSRILQKKMSINNVNFLNHGVQFFFRRLTLCIINSGWCREKTTKIIF